MLIEITREQAAELMDLLEDYASLSEGDRPTRAMRMHALLKKEYQEASRATGFSASENVDERLQAGFERGNIFSGNTGSGLPDL
jgi:hypothetical protein